MTIAIPMSIILTRVQGFVERLPRQCYREVDLFKVDGFPEGRSIRRPGAGQGPEHAQTTGFLLPLE
jgi:hypothetical protein